MELTVQIAEQIITSVSSQKTTAWNSRYKWSGETGYRWNKFQTQRIWVASYRLEEHPPEGILFITPLSPDDEVVESRKNMFIQSSSVLVGFHKKVENFDNSTIDPLVETMEQIRTTVRTSHLEDDLISWSGNVSLKDEEGMPMEYALLRERFLFESHFYAQFRKVIP